MTAGGTFSPGTHLASVRLCLVPGVRLTNLRAGRWRMEFAGARITFVLPGEVLQDIVARLAAGELSLADVVDASARQDGPWSALEQLDRLWRPGLLTQTLHGEGRVLAVLRGGSASLMPPGASDLGPVTLHESAFVRHADGAVVVESAEHGGRIELRDARLFALPTLLMETQTASELGRRAEIPAEWAATIVAWLVGVGAARSSSGLRPEPDGGVPWAFADRLFHARSRMGTHVGGYGATFPWRTRRPDPPMFRASRGGRRIELPRPDLAAVAAADASFTSVCERRRTIREHGATAITVEELGHFLYRSARVTGRFRSDRYEYTSRPYPSAGALYELEIYPLVTACRGLDAGLYWYDAAAHALEHVRDPNADTAALCEGACRSAAITTPPQVLLVLAARFDRVFWKYESVGYALILKNVGVLYELMYLVATAMNLAPCALGGGDSTAFSRAARTAVWDESSVGEFMLGRPE